MIKLPKFSHILKFILLSGLYLTVLCLLFVAIEGPVSTTKFFDHLTRPLAERTHTKYDSLLGWVNVPNKTIKDMYGPGLYLRTNAQGFRNNRDITPQVPKGRTRIICSGDSFTMGYGVDNEHTWCARLASFNHKIEPVNMGQGGYGVGQSYLWYMRDGVKLDHQVHLFALIEEDIARISRKTLFGYPKPVFRLQDSRVVVDNIPVPKRPYYVPWLTRALNAAKELHSVRLLSKLRKAITSEEPDADDSTQMLSDELRLTAAFLDTLRSENERQGRTFVVVLLPTMCDVAAPSRLGSELRNALARRGIPTIDLVREFRALPAASIDKMFLTGTKMPYLFADGHYSNKGNTFIAQNVYKHLISYIDLEGLSEGKPD